MAVLAAALELREALRKTNRKIVLAESCTAGRIAATLGVIPGISQWLCGSFVIYRNASKSSWLGIPRALLEDPDVGPVSAQVTEMLATEVLNRTPEADFSLAITGDIGPVQSPSEDGIVYCATRSQSLASLNCVRFHLQAAAPKDSEDFQGRLLRLEEATEFALTRAVEAIESEFLRP